MISNPNAIKIEVSNTVPPNQLLKSGDTIICNSEIAYTLCFMQGVDEESIKTALGIARKVLGIKTPINENS